MLFVKQILGLKSVKDPLKIKNKLKIHMVRIAGINLPAKKNIHIGLTYIFGIGLSRSKDILVEAGINPKKKVARLKGWEIKDLRILTEKNYQIEGSLKRENSLNIKRHFDIGSWVGRRHRVGLPVHGQRTKTNAQTCKKTRKRVLTK